jgi:hypothetical protein
MTSLRPPLRRYSDFTSLFFLGGGKRPRGIHEFDERGVRKYLDKFIQVFIDDILI